jgi:isopentenyl phosphate kinase
MDDLKILKIGGSIITHKEKAEPTPDLQAMRRVAKEIAKGYKKSRGKLILIHGAGSYGHPIAKKFKLNEGMFSEAQKKAFGKTQLQVNMLNMLFTEALMNEGLNVSPVNLSSSAIMNHGELINMPIEQTIKLIEQGIIPVYYGVPAYDKSKNCSILSGDRIMSYLANKLKPKLLIHVTDTDGIYTDDPKLNPDAHLIKDISGKSFENIEPYLKESVNIDITGGMYNKIKEVMQTGIDAEIINGNIEGNIIRVLAGIRGLGTSIKICEKIAIMIPTISNKRGRGTPNWSLNAIRFFRNLFRKKL